jgi:hypothetical protein
VTEGILTASRWRPIWRKDNAAGINQAALVKTQFRFLIGKRDGEPYHPGKTQRQVRRRHTDPARERDTGNTEQPEEHNQPQEYESHQNPRRRSNQLMRNTNI